MSREAVNLSDSTTAVLQKMAEGNPGAITVLMALLGRDDPAALMTLLSLDDMNMRGSQIWVGYKDHCGEDIEKFAQCINDRDSEMIATVNANSGIDERAVTSGASFDHVKGQRPDIRGLGL